MTTETINTQLLIVDDTHLQVITIGTQGPAGSGSGGGVTDHGALTGLADDDHTQYHNDARGDARYSQLGHAHTTSDITSGSFADARIAASNVTQHQAALSIAASQVTGSKTSAFISDFSEATDDRVAALLTAGSNITLTYNDAANTLTIAASGGGGGISDGDKGDITVSASGATWTIDNNAITTAKINDAAVTTAKLEATLSTKINSTAHYATPNIGGFVAGRYYDSALHATSTTTVATAADEITLTPFMAAEDLSIDRIGILISAAGAGGTTAKLVIYNAGSDGFPDTVAWEGVSNLSTAATGFVEETLSFTFTGGARYWLGVRTSGAPTLRGIAIAGLGTMGLSGSTALNYVTLLRRTLAYATAATTPWAFTATDLLSNTISPTIRMRKA